MTKPNTRQTIAAANSTVPNTPRSKEMKGLYSEDGIIGPLGVELERPNYEIVGYTSYLEKAKELRRPISSDSVSILK